MEIICDPSGVFESPRASTLARPERWLVDALSYGRETDSGVPVSWKSTLGVSAAWYCINLISDVMGQTPLTLHMKGKDGAVEEDLSHPSGKLMRRPRGAITAFQLRKLLTGHALVRGNGRAFIVRNGRGDPEDFIPLPADRTSTVVIRSGDEVSVPEKWHVVFPENGGDPIPLPDYDVLHIFKMSDDGYNGLSPLEVLRNSVGLALAGEKSANRFFRNGGVPSLVLEAPAGVFRKEEEAATFLASWNSYHSGLDNASRTGLLREGITAKPLGIPARDAQMLEQREFQVREIMRAFAVPVIPGVADSQSYNTLEQLNRAMLLHCFGPWMKIWQEECDAKLLTQRENRTETHYFEFDTWELVKPDAGQLGTMLAQLKQAMLITSNEGRNWISMPPHPDGDRLENPATTSGGNASDPPPTKPEPPANSREKSLIAAKLKPLIAAEKSRVVEMAGKARNFLDWSESFYAKHETRLTEAIVSLGGEPWMASEYIAHSKYQIVEATDCKADELPNRIEQVTAAWLGRSDELAAMIVGG